MYATVLKQKLFARTYADTANPSKISTSNTHFNAIIKTKLHQTYQVNFV